MPYFAKVAVDSATIHFDKLYTYLLPSELAPRVFPGSMVLVPFGRGNRPRMAVVLECGEETEIPPRTKTVLDSAPEDARLTPDLLRLVDFLRERAFCTYYEAVKAVIPYGAQYKPVLKDNKPTLSIQLGRTQENVYSLEQPLPQKPKPGAKQLAAVALLQEGKKLPESVFTGAGISRAVLQTLVKKGILSQTQQYKVADLFAHIPRSTEPIMLTDEQQKAFTALQADLDGKPHAALLYGVTGSGKTLVFLKLIEKALEQKRSVLVLVPEISLTPQMIYRLKSTFGGRVAVQHSALNNTERLLQWRMIQQGGADIVVGTRSAVFAPLQNLGLIIIDEEQEHTYRSESAPRYFAHDVAKQRAADNGALVVFASATPSTETYHAAETGRYRLVELLHRYQGMPMPSVELVDMRAELAAGNPGEVSLRLAQELQKNIKNGEQSILLLNRRGYRTVCACQDCGQVIKCQSCSVPMVYHKTQNHLLCHYCGKTIPLPKTCPSCGGKMRYTGFGTQRVEEELARIFPKARILRMDQDSTGQKNAHEKMLAAFARGEYDILLGTQMVAKGLDFEKVSLVGVLGIDSLLFGQGFRAYENVFSLLTQVVGRGGRAEIPGRAIVQTTNPEHPVLALAAAQNYPAFYQQEIAFRKICLYPPFCAICVVGFSGRNEADVLRAARRFSDLIGQRAAHYPAIPMRVLGPTPMGVLMVNDRYRYKLTVKCKNNKEFRALMKEVLELYGTEGLPSKAGVTLDMNSDGDL